MRRQTGRRAHDSRKAAISTPTRVSIPLGAVCTLLLAGCVSLTVQPQTIDHGPSTEIERDASARLSARQARILDAAERMLETQRFVVDGYRYNYDCTGTILAIYAMAGVPLVDLFPNYAGNGVQRLHGIADDYDLLYHSQLPQPGDLIFWDNTYDKNGDTKWNDWLTHVGLVLDVSPDGTIEYLHHHYTDGVVRARMNLTDPQTHLAADGVVVNSPMRMRSHRHLNPDEWLASHLFRELGAMHRIEL
ncbi:MAG: CHAP domain-containing protein [Spirochaetota bacterium]